MIQAFPSPSPKIQELMDVEQAKPIYAKMDSDLKALAALKAIYQKHGCGIFDPFNTTDQILLKIIEP